MYLISNHLYRKQPFLLFICISYFFAFVSMLTKVSSWKNDENYILMQKWCKTFFWLCWTLPTYFWFGMTWNQIEIFFYFSLKGESVYQYEGDRTRDDIVNFALRLVGPSVNQIESKEDFEDAKSKVIYKGILSTFTILQLLQTMLAIPIWFPLSKKILLEKII